MKFIYESIYWHRIGGITDCLNRLIQKVLGCVPAIILMIFFCQVKIFPLLEKCYPPKITPYFINESVHSTRGVPYMTGGGALLLISP